MGNELPETLNENCGQKKAIRVSNQQLKPLKAAKLKKHLKPINEVEGSGDFEQRGEGVGQTEVVGEADENAVAVDVRQRHVGVSVEEEGGAPQEVNQFLFHLKSRNQRKNQMRIILNYN